MITNYNLGQEVEVRFIGKITEAKLDKKLGVLYHIDGDKWMQAMGITGDCLFKLIEPEDVEATLENQRQKYGEELREMTPVEIEGKLE